MPLGIMKQVVYMIIFTSILTGCSKNDRINMNHFHKMYGSENDQAEELLEKVSGHRLYFGHQSVGFNILSGIHSWEEETGVRLGIDESRDLANTDTASLVHFKVGNNGDPRSKIDDFVSLVDSIPGDSASAVFFKLCYVDIMADTDVDDLFDYYKERMYFLKESYPHCQIILFTVPVTRAQRGWKKIAKKILGRELYGVEENIKRHEFNQRMLNEMNDDFPVFDLAGVETTLPDGSTYTYKYKGNEYPAMPGFYTVDIGHLNEYGARYVSYNLLAFLAVTLK